MSSSDPLDATQRWRFDLAYDGRGFSGFAYQPDRDTVVGLLRSTLASTLHLSEEPVIVGAGRTDSGVHAFFQVVHVDLPVVLKVRSASADRLVSALNKQLRGRIQILNAEPVSERFHARFSATWREYRYLVLESSAPGLGSTNVWAWSVPGPLDLVAMNRASRALLGTHDFRAFCRRPTNGPPGEPLLRRVLAARWERLDDQWLMSPQHSPALRLTIRGQSFCHNMVRCLVSTMVAIGRGELHEGEIAARLVSGDRYQLPPPAPAAGLALIGVGYDQTDQESVNPSVG
ncbi:MAG TPA: tRNA pseudouridine(38-40) synthase TruA [Acidimicrobiales bacterium]|nr:tRNA pseudouridine(38-40) synthase TruA [Acidimicrobiales bacterium]